MTGTLYLGTSGFAYDEWKNGVFYPVGVKIKDRLSYYASVFPSVEINYTFRRFPSETTLQNWAALTPESFRFTLKANQKITHWMKLKGVGDEVNDFVTRGKLLGERLGCILFQCPPSLAYNAELIEAFVETLPNDGTRYAMEFRHDSWKEARDLLHSRGIAWCVAETDEKDPGPEDLSWDPLGYLRLRKTEYTDDEMAVWAAKLAPVLAEGSDIFCYFKHEDEGASPRMAERLRTLLSES